MRVASLLAILTSTVLFSARPARAATEIPFAFRDGMICLKVRVAGQPAALNFLLDSGAGASVLDLQTARRLGLKFGSRETVQGVQGRCAAYRVDGLAANVAAIPIARSMLALDLSPVSQGCGSRIDGLLGADFFHGRIVQIDFAAQKIRLLTRGEVSTAGAQVVPLAIRNDALCIRVGVNGNAPQWMRLDTGCSSALEWVARSSAGRKDARTSIATAIGSRRSIHTDVTLGSERFAAVKTGLHDEPMFAGEAGLLGNGLLSQFRVTVDTAKSQLFLTRIK